MKDTLEGALTDATNEITRQREHYDSEAERVGHLLSESYKEVDNLRDELSQLRTHFKSSKEYSDWKRSKSPEAFQSLPPSLKSAADSVKALNEEEIVVLQQVRV